MDRANEANFVFICTADDPWTLDKVRRGGPLVTPSRHPDAVPCTKSVDGRPVYHCPHCNATFTDPTWLGPADDEQVAQGMEVVHRLLAEKVAQDAFSRIVVGMVSTTPEGDYVIRRFVLDELLNWLRKWGAK
jgi:hypothetical protein